MNTNMSMNRQWRPGCGCIWLHERHHIASSDVSYSANRVSRYRITTNGGAIIPGQPGGRHFMVKASEGGKISRCFGA
jgi:hypothetical protein